MSLRIKSPDKSPILTVPTGTGKRHACQFVAQNVQWLRSRLAEIPDPVIIADGSEIPLRGILHKICFVESAREIVITSGNRIEVCGRYGRGPGQLLNWLCQQAVKDITVRVGQHSQELGLQPSRIRVADQSSRWGSCSASGTLSFSWRLVMAPEFVLDYVAAHEVAHLREMNHSKEFWRLVRQVIPDIDKARGWLRENGASLHSYVFRD
jgi:predicted metal-dependent hydrolase